MKSTNGADLGVLFGARLELCQCLGEFQVRAVEDAVGVTDVADLLLAEAAPLQALRVHRVRHGRIARHHHVRRHVARDDGAAGEKGVGADLGELMDRREPAQDHPVADLTWPPRAAQLANTVWSPTVQSWATWA